MAKQTMADKVREAMAKKVAEKPASTGDPAEWHPDFGAYRIRLLPPIGSDFPKNPYSISESEMFYYSQKFHFIPSLSMEEVAAGKFEPKGKFLWVSKDLYDKNGVLKRDPISEAVKQWYAVGREENDQSLKNLGGALKLKRHYFTNIILYHEDGSFEYRRLVDRTNEGKLMKVICAAMGLPFIRDIDDNWVDNENYFDPDQEYYDLIDPDNGFDFKIVKEKTGNNNWDISFEKSFVMKKSQRTLSDEEKELMAERINLRNAVDVTTSYEAVKAELDNFLGEDYEDEEDEAEKTPKTKVTSKPGLSSKPKTKKTEVADEEDDVEGLDDMLDELDD